MLININDNNIELDILLRIPFDSDRKRMSIIIK